MPLCVYLSFALCTDPGNVEPHCERKFWEVEGNSKVSSQRNVQPIWKWAEATGTKVILFSITQVWVLKAQRIHLHWVLSRCFFFLPGWPRRTTWMWWRVYFPRSQSVDPVGKRLQRDVLDVRENGTVTGKTYIDMSPAASWYPHELWNASWYPGSWTTWCKILFILLVFRECQVKHWPKHKKACQLMGTEASETIQRDQTINS